MIITRTPFRISFFGGGTDYPTWYRKHGGAVLSTTIDKYSYLTVRYLPPFFEHRIRVVYSKIENCHTIDEIQHPAVRGILNHLNFQRGVEIHHDGDLPARSGMGSSSSFSVGLLHALHALRGQLVSKHELAMESIHIEQEVLKETVGSQDQVSAAYGGFNHISFLQNGEINVRPITVTHQRLAELEKHMLLFYTGIRRTAHEVASSYVPTLTEKTRQLRILREMADEATSIIGSSSPISDFGELLDEAWNIKRSLGTKISNSTIDNLYQKAINAGAYGGKITGAGGGGFMLLCVPPEKQVSLIQAMEGTLHVPFHFESAGSQLIFFDPEQDYTEAEKDRDTSEFDVQFRELSQVLQTEEQ